MELVIKEVFWYLIWLVASFGAIGLYFRMANATFDDESERRYAWFSKESASGKFSFIIYSLSVLEVFRKHHSAYPKSHERKFVVTLLVISAIAMIVVEELAH